MTQEVIFLNPSRKGTGRYIQKEDETGSRNEQSIATQQTAWSLFVFFVVALVALQQIIYPHKSTLPNPLPTQQNLAQEENSIGRIPASSLLAHPQ